MEPPRTFTVKVGTHTVHAELRNNNHAATVLFTWEHHNPTVEEEREALRQATEVLKPWLDPHHTTEHLGVWKNQEEEAKRCFEDWLVRKGRPQ